LQHTIVLHINHMMDAQFVKDRTIELGKKASLGFEAKEIAGFV